MRLGDRDPALRQFERDAVIACGVMAAGALIASNGRPDVAAGVVAGGTLTAASYWAIKGAVTLVTGVVGPAATAEDDAPEKTAGNPPLSAGNRVMLAVKFFTRYALLAVGAYVMLTWLRVHPVGLLIGATTPFVAAVMQAVRSSRATSRREHP